MVARVVLATAAVLVLAWVGVLARNYETGRDAALRAFFGPTPSEAERRRDMKRLERAELLDPNAYWRVAQAYYRLREGDRRRAARIAEQLARDEPRNLFAWSALRQATERSDPARAAQAAAEIRRLNPLRSR